MLVARPPTSMMLVPVGTVQPIVCADAAAGASSSARVIAEKHLRFMMMPAYRMNR
jgi:hypothetical protein